MTRNSSPWTGPALTRTHGESGPVVLVVEDDTSIRHLIGKILTQCGCRPLMASGGSEALRLYDANAPDIQLVLLDWNLPGTSGGEILAALLARRSDLRVVLVTGATEATTDEHATADTVSILLKPFTAAELTMVVRSVLGA